MVKTTLYIIGAANHVAGIQHRGQMPPASAFRHPAPPSGTGSFRYWTGFPYSGTGLHLKIIISQGFYWYKLINNTLGMDTDDFQSLFLCVMCISYFFKHLLLQYFIVQCLSLLRSLLLTYCNIYLIVSRKVLIFCKAKSIGK